MAARANEAAAVAGKENNACSSSRGVESTYKIDLLGKNLDWTEYHVDACRISMMTRQVSVRKLCIPLYFSHIDVE